MKILSPFLIAVLFFPVIGCDGDGDGVGVSADTTAEETDTVEGPEGPVTIAMSSETALLDDDSAVVLFNIPGPGVIEAIIEWSSGPSTLAIGLYHTYSAVGVSQPSIQSPAILQTQATQDLLDDSSEWAILIAKDKSEQFTFNYTVTFTPD